MANAVARGLRPLVSLAETVAPFWGPATRNVAAGLVKSPVWKGFADAARELDDAAKSTSVEHAAN